jgi:hypothetical protein
VGILGGILLIAGIAVIAGAIAYVGDRVGHQVGRRRLSLFGLRPKYTSTIVAVATGMLIALAVTLTTLVASQYARAAFFNLSEVNDRVNQLQAEADKLDRRVHETNVVVNRGDLVYDPFLLLTPQQSEADRMKLASAFFDAVVTHVNRTYVPQGLRPYKGSAADPAIQAKLRGFLHDPRIQGFLLEGPVVALAVADQNLFVNEPINFALVPYADKVIFAAHQPITSVEVVGGTNVQPQAAFSQLLTGAEAEAIRHGMPLYFARPIPLVSAADVNRDLQRIKSGRGRFRIVAAAAQDIHPSLGAFPVEIRLEEGGSPTPASP